MTQKPIIPNEETILETLRPKCEASASAGLRRRIAALATDGKGEKEQRLRRPSRRPLAAIVWSAAAVAALFCGLLFIPAVSARELLQQAATAFGESFSIKFEARTLPHENFAYYDARAPFVPVSFELASNGWLIDKGGRIATGNDSVSYMWMPQLGVGYIARRAGSVGFIEEFGRLLNPRLLLQRALDSPTEKMRLSRNEGYVELAMSEGEYTCRYRFDEKRQRLLSYSITEQADGNEVELLRTLEIAYGTPQTLAVDLPDDIHWIDALKPRSAYKGLSAQEATRRLLSLFEQWQADALADALYLYKLENLESLYSGATIVEIGRERVADDDPDRFFVPYKLRLRDGGLKELQLALRLQPDGSWIIDGGL